MTSMLESNNTFCHINHLPAEILREIFVLGLSDNTSSKRTRTVSFVCRYWRLLALEECRLWLEISIELRLSDAPCWSGTDCQAAPVIQSAELERAALWLSRSKGAPLILSISLDRVPEYVHQYVKDLVSPHYHRCKRLELILDRSDTVENARIWLPLPDSTFDHLDELYIVTGLTERDRLDLGPPLTLRRLHISTWAAMSFHPGLRLTDEVLMDRSNFETVSGVLKHCRDVKKINIQSYWWFDPLPALSLPTLEELTLHLHPSRHSIIRNAPNLRYLDCRGLSATLWELRELDKSTRSDILRVFSGLEVLVIQDPDFHASGHAACFESLRVMRTHRLNDDVIRLLASSSSVPLPFPALQLLVIHWGASVWYRNGYQPLFELLWARPTLNLIFDFCNGPPPELDCLGNRAQFVENLWEMSTEELLTRFLC
ncbi:uncharacterized protein EI90DRAFT_3041254 [Cantharellus anzutake]|uniref:uncharacterized protein n=1 Tax=Cantharellus anzutake TaxID=1750568 RepID=UPI001903D767|nr:uncharacterized protein EI90DRAFT_3041254 [Cantharellus anzutake]KAF8337994.1 hypothetical protein EI90DRAFT_3041254 [Cantharellus anzutake]